jgi:hypothetical protein
MTGLWPSSPTFNHMAPAKALRGGKVLELGKETAETKGKNERTSIRKPLSRPGGSQPAWKGLTIHRKRALVGESEMTPSSVGSEPQSRVKEPRNKDKRGSLRACDSGDNTETPQRFGVEVRPGSKSTAERQWGLQGSWEPERSADRLPQAARRVERSDIKASCLLERMPEWDHTG